MGWPVVCELGRLERDTFGEHAVRPVRIRATWKDGRTETFEGGILEGAPAEEVRPGLVARFDVVPGRQEG